MRKRLPRERLAPHLLRLHEQFVHVAGEIASVAIEREVDERKIDHVWINLRAGDFGQLQLALSTCSRQNRAAGFDPHVRVGVIASPWEASALPPAGVRSARPLDYALLEAEHPVTYQAYKRKELEQLLLERTERAVFAEAWGDFYVRSGLGVHQIHSRRGSLAVPADYVGRDGALQLYFRAPDVREMLLFKFAGQP